MNKISHVFIIAIITVNLFAGTIKGTVTLGTEKSVISGVSVLLVDQKVRFSTNENGEFIIPNLTNGTHTLEISYLGFKKEIIQNIEISNENNVQELTVQLHESPFQLGEIVVTGTRTAKQLSDVPIPTSIVTQKEIAARNAVRLDDILSEQTGISTVAFLGTGVQLQGLDADYTLILVDGEPVIGRRGGTLDLKRINIGNVKQIEIVKGPTSALYGSDALAGVINIITAPPEHPFGGKFSFLYSTNNSLDFSTALEAVSENVSASIFLQRSNSDGYDLEPSTPALSSPKFVNNTISPKIHYVFDNTTDLQIAGRIFLEESDDPTIEKASLVDWSIAPKVTHKFTSEMKLAVKGYSAQYKTTEDFFSNGSSPASHEIFDQGITKFEGEFSAALKSSYIISTGAGYFLESVEANRISTGKRKSSSYFAYAQNEWIPASWFDVVASYRFDAHSDYSTYFSPKISLMLRPIDEITFRTSLGSGFKAPTFQQLYLNFTNLAAGTGYTVYGAVDLAERINIDLQNGNIQSILMDPNTIQAIRPEHSVAYNIGIDTEPVEEIFIRINAFYNNIIDLIETITVAQKTNNAFIYSYANLNKVFTQGIETEIKFSPVDELTASAGYQYLEAKDKQVLDDIRAGKIFKPTPNGARKIKESEYGGLLNRSSHSGNLKLLYDYTATGTMINLTFIVRGKYGYADLNGNLILDDKSEYVKGYALTNISLMQEVWNTLTIHAGINNVFDRTNPQLIPSLSGRIIYGGLSYQFK